MFFLLIFNLNDVPGIQTVRSEDFERVKNIRGEASSQSHPCSQTFHSFTKIPELPKNKQHDIAWLFIRNSKYGV